MSTNRRTLGVYASPTPRGPAGERLCRNCRKALEKGQRHNCSKECSEMWMLRTSPSHARYRVWERDKGVCAKCHEDAVADKFDRRGVPRHNSSRNTGDLWQVDHITPVIEGGGECGLDGLQTLCTACHRQETAELARRRKLRRIADKALPLLAGGDL